MRMRRIRNTIETGTENMQIQSRRRRHGRASPTRRLTGLPWLPGKGVQGAASDRAQTARQGKGWRGSARRPCSAVPASDRILQAKQGKHPARRGREAGTQPSPLVDGMFWSSNYPTMMSHTDLRPSWGVRPSRSIEPFRVSGDGAVGFAPCTPTNRLFPLGPVGRPTREALQNWMAHGAVKERKGERACRPQGDRYSSPALFQSPPAPYRTTFDSSPTVCPGEGRRRARPSIAVCSALNPLSCSMHRPQRSSAPTSAESYVGTSSIGASMAFVAVAGP